MVSSDTYMNPYSLNTNQANKRDRKRAQNKGATPDRVVSHFTDEEIDYFTDPEWDDSFLENQQSQQESTVAESPTKRQGRLYELLLAIALLYGVGVFLVWQQSQTQLGSMEDELAALQHELTEIQMAAITENAAATASTNSTNAKPPLVSFETTYLQFEASPSTVDTAREVAPQVDALYQQYAADFNLDLKPAVEKVTIIIDGGNRQNNMDEHIWGVASPERAAASYSITEAEALAHTLSSRVATHSLQQAIQSRAIKPQWKPFAGGIQWYLLREHGHNPEWKQQRPALSNRHFAQGISLERLMQMIRTDVSSFKPDGYGGGTDSGVYSSTTITGPLVEYMVETYGYAHVATLLDAFEEHETWETLGPAVYEISASEFEARWQRYLATHYPVDVD